MKIFTTIVVPAVLVLASPGYSGTVETASVDASPETKRADAAPAPFTMQGWLAVGIFYPNFKTKARLDLGLTKRGTTIDLEKDLGMDSELAVASIRSGLQFKPRWRAEAEYFRLDRSALGVASRTIEWGEEVFEVGTTIKSFFDVQVIRFAAGYDFYRKDDRLLGVSIGTHVLTASAGIGAALAVGQIFANTVVEEDASTSGLFPVPNIGFYGNYRLAERWRLDGRLDWFGISIGEWDGTLFTADLSLVYYLTDRIYAGAGIQYFDIVVNYNTRLWKGQLNYQHFGPRLGFGIEF